MIENTVKASALGVRLAPRKVSLVAGLVRGRSVDDALVILSHTPKRAAKPLAKLIASAKSNATNNHGLKAENLNIDSLRVSAGARLKRYRPVARGMAHAYQKRTSNVFIVISGDVKPKAAPKNATTVSKKSTGRKPASTKKEAK